MSDRLQEIRARLDAATPGPWEYDHVSRSVIGEPKWSGTSREVVRSAGHFNGEFIAHAPDDIAWLLDEVERLRNTNLSVSQPLCDGVDVEPMRTENGTELLRDDSVVQGVTKRECGPNTLDEIRAVIDAGGPVFTVDARYLLEQVDELTKRVRMYEVVKS